MDFPQGTQDLYDLLGAHAHDEHEFSHDHPKAEEKFPDFVSNHALSSEGKALIAHPHLDEGEGAPQPEPDTEHGDENPKVVSLEKETHTFVINKGNLLRWAKNSWPYLTIFAVALFFFLILFTNFSVTSWFKSSPSASKIITAKDYPNLDAYNAWISSYFFEITDPKILDPNYDISGNGLTNYQKFVLGLNPKRTDTMGLGMSDSQALIAGVNPLTGNPLNDDQKKIVARYVDLEALSNRISLAAANTSARVAGASTDSQDLSGNGVSIDSGYNGVLDIPSLNISVPVVWTKETANFNTDLQNGVVHYPGTAMPGQIGTAYISGHSSNYAWAKGNYNKIFSTLGDLKDYDGFTITVRDTNGKTAVLHYVVMKSQIYTADDQAQFANQGKSIVALSTCWPVGTSAKRLVVFGELSQTDHQ